MTQKSNRCRAWCMTINNYTGDEIFPEEGVAYQIVGREVCPTTGTPHLQCYVRYKSARTFQSMKKKYPKAHIEKAKGNDEHNHVYCGKDADLVIESGEPKQQGRRTDLDDIRKMIDDGKEMKEVAQQHFGSYCRYYKGFEKYQRMVQPKRDWKTRVIVLWGDAGTGKTRAAHELGGEIISVTQSGFVQGYSNQEVVIFDDFEGGIQREVFMQMMDRYRMTVNIKGAEAEWNPKTIVITSNKSPYDWGYKIDAAFKRRLDKVVKYYKDDQGQCQTHVQIDTEVLTQK